jgi:hypothetical protein
VVYSSGRNRQDACSTNSPLLFKERIRVRSISITRVALNVDKVVYSSGRNRQDACSTNFPLLFKEREGVRSISITRVALNAG